MQLDPGDHAFLSYGPISNDDLLQYYGFVERENPFDTYLLQDMATRLRTVSDYSLFMDSKLLPRNPVLHEPISL